MAGLKNHLEIAKEEITEMSGQMEMLVKIVQEMANASKKPRNIVSLSKLPSSTRSSLIENMRKHIGWFQNVSLAKCYIASYCRKARQTFRTPSQIKQKSLFKSEPNKSVAPSNFHTEDTDFRFRPNILPCKTRGHPPSPPWHVVQCPLFPGAVKTG
jgi:hypothetical protein